MLSDKKGTACSQIFSEQCSRHFRTRVCFGALGLPRSGDRANSDNRGLAANTLGVLDAHAASLFPRVWGCLRIYPRSQQKAKRRNTSNPLPVVIVNLDDGFAISQRNDLAHISLRFYKVSKSFAGTL